MPDIRSDLRTDPLLASTSYETDGTDDLGNTWNITAIGARCGCNTTIAGNRVLRRSASRILTPAARDGTYAHTADSPC